MSEYSFCVAHNGEEAAANGITVIDGATGKVQTTIGLEYQVRALVGAPGATVLYALLEDREVRVVDLAAYAVTATLAIEQEVAHEGRPIAVSADGTRLYLGHVGGVSEIDTATRTVVRTFTVEGQGFCSALAVSPDGRYLYAAFLHDLVMIDREDDTRPAAFNLPAPARWAALSTDGALVYVYTQTRQLHVLDAGDLTAAHDATDLRTVDASMAVHPDGKRLLLADWGLPHTLDARTLELRPDFYGSRLTDDDNRTLALALSPDGTAFCAADNTAVIRRTDGDFHDRVLTAELPGRAIAIVTAAAPAGAQATRLETSDTHPLAPLRVPGLTARLTTASGSPVAGEPLRFTSAGGLDLGTATTGSDGYAHHSADVLLPLDPATGAVDTSRLTGIYTVTYTGKPAYRASTAEGAITLG
ncbi:hypothetical protein [Streptomyces vinaceus]|uniref:hypothetical protein n=1 Tax=Streptomyces vinaceus TaxID=1960 RepID=UPI003802B7C3